MAIFNSFLLVYRRVPPWIGKFHLLNLCLPAMASRKIAHMTYLPQVATIQKRDTRINDSPDIILKNIQTCFLHLFHIYHFMTIKHPPFNSILFISSVDFVATS